MRTIAALALILAGPACAAETASFLDIGVGARGLGMGGAYTALADDAHSIYWNPAGLAALDKREIAASHAELANSTRLDFIAYGHPTPLGVFAADATYLSQGALEGRDALGHPTGNFQASDAEAGFGYGRKTEWADLGATVKFVQSHIASAQAQTVAADLGAHKTLGALSLGAALRNLGPGMKFGSETNDLPLRLALGAAYKFQGGHSVSADLTNGPRGAGSDFGIGGEFKAVKNVFLRGGYTTKSSISGGTGFDAARGLTLGLGYRDGRWSLDYAAVPMGELGSTHRFTLGARF